MTNAESIFLIITIIGVWYTMVKIARKSTKWWWNFAPFTVGFCVCLWVARIFG